MKGVNFISLHLVKKIEKLISDKQLSLKHEGFYYFDQPISDGRRIINRVNKFAPYIKEEILPVSWYSLKGDTLMRIFFLIKNNQFYIYKKIKGKDYKVRLKNEKAN